MVTRHLKLEGPATKGVSISAAVLRDLLTVLIEGSQRALRVRTEGRSTARGTLPAWISAASEFSVKILEGSTVLEVEAPVLAEAAPDRFRQSSLFPEVSPDLPAFDYLVESLDAALQGADRADLYDREMLRSLERLGSVFHHGIARITIAPEGTSLLRHRIEVTSAAMEDLRVLEARIPRPQRARVAGKLEMIRHSDLTFTLVLSSGEKIRGVAEPSQISVLQDLWGRQVLVSGTVRFTATGAVQSIEADQLEPTDEGGLRLWGAVPEPVGRAADQRFRVSQGPRSGINALMGQWPGDEGDDLISSELDHLS